MMHTGNAFIRLICILCMVEGCYSLTCPTGSTISNTYSPIVQGLTCEQDCHGEYTYVDQYMGADRYKNANDMYLYKPDRVTPYNIVLAPVSNRAAAAKFFNSENAVNAGAIPTGLSERCPISNGGVIYTPRQNVFNPNMKSSVCVCNKGWTQSGNGCQECNVGKYKSLIGTSACLDCPGSSTSSIGSTALAACVCSTGRAISTTYSPIVIEFLCKLQGNGQYTYQGEHGGSGFYKNTNNVYLFRPSTSHTYRFGTSMTGSTDVATTTSMDVHNIASTIKEDCIIAWRSRLYSFDPNPVSAVCLCDKGWGLVDTECTKCGTGKYKSSIGNSICSACPVNSNSTVGSTACTCNAGYSSDVNTGECNPCSTGTYKANPGSGGCTPCSTGTFQANSASTECTECPWGEYTSTTGASSSTLCTKCEFQHHPRSDGGGCERCAISFKASVLTSASSGIGKIPGCIEFVN